MTRTITRNYQHCENDEVICPYCGYETIDTWDINNGNPVDGEEYSCEECEKKFYWTREYEVIVRTTKSCTANREDHNLVDYHKDMKKCTKCGDVVADI